LNSSPALFRQLVINRLDESKTDISLVGMTGRSE
jgi:hypothetical protein